jgi:hypothetical protein
MCPPVGASACKTQRCGSWRKILPLGTPVHVRAQTRARLDSGMKSWFAAVVFRIAVLAAAALGVVTAMGQPAGQARPLLAAAASQTFTDPAGDNAPGAPDITTIQFSNDDAGRFEVRVTLANRPELVELDFVSVFLDTDQNSATGCDAGNSGFDYSLGAEGHADPTPDFFDVLRCLKGHPDRFTPQRTLTGEFDSSTSTIVWRFGCAEIGRPHDLRLVVVASHGDPQGDPSLFASDFAGLEPWLYHVSPACGRDKTRPLVAALPSVGVRGKKAKLNFRVQDDSGYTKESYVIYSGKKRIARTTSKAFASADATKTYYATWPVPKQVAKNLRFCVSAVDEAKNRSGTSCASLTIR